MWIWVRYRTAPEMVAGPGSFDSLANALPHVVAKRGALGVFCCASAATGRGGALKVEDGSMRAMRPALAPLFAEGVQIALDERCPVLGTLPDELYSLAGNPPTGVYVNDSVFPLL